MESKLNTKEAKTHFGLLLNMAQHQPVTIEKNGRPVAVILSIHDFSHFEQIEDELLALKAMQAEKDGWLDQNATAKFLAGLGATKKTYKTTKHHKHHAKNSDH